MKDATADILRSDAKRAAEEGRTIFAPMLNTPNEPPQPGAVTSWAEMIEAVENEGWELSHWRVSIDPKARPFAYPLFRRNAH
jgi:hypothetical protein